MIRRLLTARPARQVVPAVMLVLALVLVSVQLLVQLSAIPAQALEDTAADIVELTRRQAARIDAHAEFGIEHGRSRLVGSLALDPRVSGAWVVAGDGQVLASLRRRDIGQSFDAVAESRPEALATALQAAAFPSNAGRPQRAPEASRLAISREVLLQSDPSRYGMLVVEADTGPVAATLREQAGKRFWTDALTVIVLVAFAWWLLWAVWTTRSGELADAAQRLWLEGEELKVGVDGGDELAQVARSLEDASRRIHTQARLLRTVGRVSLAAQRLTDRDALGVEICRLLVEEGGYSLAGLARLQPDGHRLIPTAQVGIPAQQLPAEPADLDDPMQQSRPSVRVMQSGETLVHHDLASEPVVHPAVEPYRHAGIRSLAVVPLIEMGQRLGLLFIGDRRPGVFDADFIAAVGSSAADISANIILRERERAAAAAEHRLAIALRAADLGAWESDLLTGEMIASDRWYEMLGLNPHRDFEVAGRWRERVHPDDEPLLERAYARIADPAVDNFEIDMRLLHAAGHWAWIHSRGMVVARDPQGRPIRLAGVHLDMTARRRDEVQLRIAADAFASSHEGILICDADGAIVSVNQAFERVTGYSAAEAVGRRPSMLSSGHQGPDFYRAMWDDIRAHGRWEGEIWNRRKSGEVYPEWLAVTRITHSDGRVNYLGQFIDISERKQIESRLDKLGRSDPLTGLPNRRAFADRVAERLLEPEARLGLLMLNLDRFKQVNDSFGYTVGDEVLRQVSKRLEDAVDGGTLTARVSGDEFAVLLPGADEARVRHAGEQVQQAMQASLEVEGHRLVLGISMGAALAPQHGSDAELLLVSAASALNESRADGLHQLRVYSPRQAGASLRRLTLESQLRLALQKHELFALFQPQVSLATGELVGLESLVRWRHPERGIVPPGEFIPVAEEAGLIGAIGDFMLRESCRALDRLRRAGLPPVPVSVNIAASQLRRADFLPQLMAEVEAVGLPPSALEVEITESMLMADAAQTIGLLGALRERGFRIAIDDFGTGYSSLSYLAQLPLDRLKVDQSFVRALRTSAPAEGIVRAVVSLGRSLHLNVLAEGVEETADANRLRELGCDDAQGWLYAKPLDEAGLLDRYARR